MVGIETDIVTLSGLEPIVPCSHDLCCFSHNATTGTASFLSVCDKVIVATFEIQ